MILILQAFVSCKKDREPVPAACSDTVPANEMCQAYFTRWFYDPVADQCRQVGYSGCSEKGFATEMECDACVGSSDNMD
jgi:hypothetical protein